MERNEKELKRLFSMDSPDAVNPVWISAEDEEQEKKLAFIHDYLDAMFGIVDEEKYDVKEDPWDYDDVDDRCFWSMSSMDDDLCAECADDDYWG